MVKTFFHKNDSEIVKLIPFLTLLTDKLVEILPSAMKYSVLKFNFVVEITYFHPVTGELKDVVFKLRNKFVDLFSNLPQILADHRTLIYPSV